MTTNNFFFVKMKVIFFFGVYFALIIIIQTKKILKNINYGRNFKTKNQFKRTTNNFL